MALGLFVMYDVGLFSIVPIKSRPVVSFSLEEALIAYNEINANAKPIYGFLSALVAAVPSVIYYFLLPEIGIARIPSELAAIPPLAIGLTARFVGRVFKLSHRIPIGFVSMIVYGIGCYFVLDATMWIGLPASFVAGVSFSKIRLERIHHFAFDQIELGRIKL